MKRSILLLVLSLSLLLSGCGWLDGSYVSITPHREQRQYSQNSVAVASNYMELIEVLEKLIADGTEMAAINVAEFPEEALTTSMHRAVRYIRDNYPLGAYAVEKIEYELGSSSGQPAMAVSITYRHSRAEIQQIHRISNVKTAERLVEAALKDFDASVVLLITEYEGKDFTQTVYDYAELHPEVVMETPQVTETIYGTGRSRVVELTFAYQTSRDALRRMQTQVSPVFDSAALYVSGDGADRQKFAQLYGFLMERFDYIVETSITPSYSLLRHGVGDSRAFATVYAAMCRTAGLECLTVTGTHAGEPRTWNIVCDDGQYFHVDLLQCNEDGRFRELTDAQMSGYVWDYSAYPQCSGETAETEPEETVETTQE